MFRTLGDLKKGSK